MLSSTGISTLDCGAVNELSAEIERSRLDAESFTEADLILTLENLEKYRSVPETATGPLRHAYRLLGDVRGRRVMDYGCGAGENSIILAALGAEVTGIDISPDLIGLSKKRMALNHVHWRALVRSAYQTDEPDGSYDALLGIAILHHLDLEQSAKEVHRILKRGGIAVFLEPVRDLALLRWLRLAVPVPLDHVAPGEYPLNSDKILAFSSRFEVVDRKRFSSPWGRLWARLGSRPPTWLRRADMWLNERLTWTLAPFEVFRIRKR